MKVSIRPHATVPGWYTIDYRPDGVKGKREREHYESYELAAAQKEALEGKPLRQAQPTIPRLRDIVDEYLSHCERNLSPATVDNKRARLKKHIIPALGDRRVKDLNQPLLDRYGENMKASVYLKDIHHISAIVSWMVKRRYAVKMDWTPEQKRATARVKRLPRMTDAERVIAALPKENHRIMCKLMLYAGLRWNEVRNLRWENCDSYVDLVPVEGRDLGIWERAVTVIARTTKNGDEEVVAVPSNCHDWFDCARQQKGLMFPGEKGGDPLTRLSYPLNQVGKSIGVRMTPHMFRHVSGTELYRRTRDIFKVMQHLRHKNLKDTQIYVRYAAVWQRESVETLVR